MRVPNQNSALARLEGEVLQAVDKVRKRGLTVLNKQWAHTRELLQSAIVAEYRQDFRGKSWSFPVAVKKGTVYRINSMIHTILTEFYTSSQRATQLAFRETYRTSALRNAWMLDNLTPNKMKVQLPQSRMFFESLREAPKVYKGPETDTSWKERWATWTDAYSTSLQNNLKLGAINESTPEEAANEVEATRAGTPASFLLDALSRIFVYQSLSVATEAQKDIVEANPEMGVEEIWQTRYNSRVCDICDANKGLTRDEATDVIPAHPNCECYWRLVPKSWAELLQSGDVADRELARRLDAAGKVPGSMLMQDGDGNLVGAVIVSFDKWVDGQPVSITSGM